MKKLLASLLLCTLALALLVGCGKRPATSPTNLNTPDSAPTSEAPVAANERVILSTTTSTQDSGLLDYILPDFTAKTGYKVDVVAVGTGAALQMGRDGDADVLLVHAKADEEAFVAEGYGLSRHDVMYNDFVIVGPKDGAIAYNEDVDATFQAIYDSSLTFVSRGDDSGTHKKELTIWKGLDLNPETFSGYMSVGQGMGATLGIASQISGYCLTDRATWLIFEDKGNLDIICEHSEGLLNYYGVIMVEPKISGKSNVAGGKAFIEWILSPETQELIGEFGVAEYGASLFIPNAK